MAFRACGRFVNTVTSEGHSKANVIRGVVRTGNSESHHFVRPTTYFGEGGRKGVVIFLALRPSTSGVSWDYNMSKILLVVGLAKYYFGLSVQQVYNDKN